jgi:UPF0755 protein
VKRPLLLFLGLFLACTASLLGTAFWMYHQISHPLNLQDQHWVQPGDTWRGKLEGILDRNLNLAERAYLKFVPPTNLQQGVFSLEQHWSFKEIVARLEQPSDLLQVLVKPGDNMYLIAEALEQAGIVSAESILTTCKNRGFVERYLELDVDRCEGYLLPESYQFVPGSSAETVLSTMIRAFKQSVGPIVSRYGVNPEDPKALHRIVTLASVVEKETGAAHERPIIASVFLNRIIRGMRLQSDPTTIYGIWERFDGNIRRKDLREKTAYNTYAINGLPPTPIASPSLQAIEAILRPANTPFLYFVAKGQSGEHFFSRSYAEHKQAVQKYQLGR